jgi:hypothetical protein
MLEKAKTSNISISTADGRVISDNQLTATRVTLGPIPKEKEFAEVDIQLVVKKKDAEALYNALASGEIYIEVNRATIT